MVADVVLEVEKLCVSFQREGGHVHAVDDLSYSLRRGETLGVVGESGAGKTLHAHAIMGLAPRSAQVTGEVAVNGRSLRSLSDTQLSRVRGDRIAIVFQDPHSSLNPLHRVGDQVAEPLRLHRGLGRFAAWREAVELLRLVGLAEPELQARHYPHQLSGGMLQRVAVAMAMACRPDVLIADEPTSALDVTTQARVLEVIRDLQERTGVALVLISHDVGMVAGMVDTVLVMQAGRAVEIGPVGDIFASPKHPHTVSLVEAARLGYALPCEEPHVSAAGSGTGTRPDQAGMFGLERGA